MENTNKETSIEEVLSTLNAKRKNEITEEDYIFVKNFKNNLHRIMDEKGFHNQADVYKKKTCHIDKSKFSTLYNTELKSTNYRYPNTKELISLADTLDVSVDRLLGREDTDNKEINLNYITKYQLIKIIIDLLRNGIIKISINEEEGTYFDEASGFQRGCIYEYAEISFTDENTNKMLMALSNNYKAYEPIWDSEDIMNGIIKHLASDVDTYPLFTLPFV